MASEVEDSELIALRSAVLASIKPAETVTESNQTDDDEDLEALREAALLSRKRIQNNVIQNNVTNNARGNSHSYKRRINNSFHSHNRNGNHKRNLERSNLIVINPVPIVTPTNDNNSIIPTSKLLISKNMKNVMISDDDSSSPKMVYSKSKGYNRFSRFESESYSDSDSDSSDYRNDRSDDFICSDEKEILRESDFSSVEIKKQHTDLFCSSVVSNSAGELEDDLKLASCDDKLHTDISAERNDDNIVVINSPDKHKTEIVEEQLVISDEKEISSCKLSDDLKPSTENICSDIYKGEHINNQERLSKTVHKDDCDSEKVVDHRKEKGSDSDSLKNHWDKTSERKEISFNSSKNDSFQSKYLGWDLRMQLNCNNKSRSPSVNSLSSRSHKSLSRSRSPSPVLKSVLSVVKQVPERKSRSERSRSKKDQSIISRRRRDTHKSQRDVFCVISPRRSEKNSDDTKKCASSTEEARKLPIYMRLGVSVKNIHKSSKRNSSSSPSEDRHKEKRIKVIKCSTSDCEKQRRVTFSRSDDDRCHSKHHKENSVTEHKKKSSEKKSGRKEKRSHLHRKR
ncbi:putative leucine-rich repeat-containing protein DDB_G0290503 isoform X2 [Centruroides vittatus]|uniref:putative leucine-rich repeat-containing protein DDB_G0290503 isoform X2 n=1 Tax=Centruroides vittatus TaxID=120091 RepID=UPI00350EC0A0